jgi:ribosomal protein S2
MTDDLVKRLRGRYVVDYDEDNQIALCDEAADRIEQLEAALRTIDNAIPKNDPTLPAICLVAGDVAEGALNGTWPAFGVMPRAALEGKDGETL